MGMNDYQALLQEMAAFVRVADSGSFSSAARQLGTTPSAVSKQISRLEKAMGVRLLERTTRKLRLSESGVEACRRCRQMVEAARSVMDVGGQFCSEPQGLLRVSVPKAVGHRVLHPHIPAFLERYPKLDVQLLLDDGHVDLIGGNIDLAIRITDRPPPGLAGRPLMLVDHVVCASPDYLARRGAPSHPRDLARHDCIYLGEDVNDNRWKFMRGDEATMVTVRGRYAANHSGVRLDAALKGIGVGSLPGFAAREALADGRLVQLLPDWTFLASYYGTAWMLYSPSRFPSPKLRVFIDHLLDCLKGGAGAAGIEVG
ncbi:transcriptional regulator [Chromobacterium phragmitis]|uniref:Transcriptional regulator n=2 Tax=Chromobacterium phragmitis TaxID=2202141 RepID=A0A344UF70_9NEIS|nr:transcriptional regulator [Chromobacterium phragmitis]